jgi:hypothetical protein
MYSVTKYKTYNLWKRPHSTEWLGFTTFSVQVTENISSCRTQCCTADMMVCCHAGSAVSSLAIEKLLCITEFHIVIQFKLFVPVL